MPATSIVATEQVELSVVVPAYNEERRLARTLQRLHEYLRTQAYEWELIVVDDGSTDGTAGVVTSYGRGHPRIRLVRTVANRGKGHAVRTGVLASRGRRVLFTDADLATPIEDVDGLQHALDLGAAAAIGSRRLPTSRIGARQPPAREVLGRVGNRAIRLLARCDFADTQCGFKLWDGDRARLAFTACRVDGWGFDSEVLYLFTRFGWPVAEVPVRWSHHSGSKVRPHDYAEVLLALLRLRTIHSRTLRTAVVPGVR